jgi:hypothetical protein
MRATRAALVSFIALSCTGKSGGEPAPKGSAIASHDSTRHPLGARFEAELDLIRADPFAAIGFGEKAFIPYGLVHGDLLVRVTSSEIIPRLSAEALDVRNDKIFRYVMLQILARRPELAVDDTLLAALADPTLRPLAAHFLGRPGFKDYPARARPSVEPILQALGGYLDDKGTYLDPWYRENYAVADLVLGAFVRLAGPETFTFIDPKERDFIGYTLDFPSTERTGLLAQAKARVGQK